jgi:hypothetical protein
MRLFILTISAAAFFSFTAQAWAQSYRDFRNQAEALSVSSEQADFVWTSVSMELLQSTRAPRGPRLSKLRRQLHATVEKAGAMDLIRRQRAVYSKHLGSNPEENRVLKLFDFFLSGHVGSARNANDLEEFLLEMHLELNKKISPRTEYLAYVLRKGDETRVYASFGLKNDGVAPHLSAPSTNALNADLESGWRVWIHLHSHPFSLTGKEDIGGAVIPSEPDIYAFSSQRKALGVQLMLVSNGFHTMTLTSSDLRRFPKSMRTWPPRM